MPLIHGLTTTKYSSLYEQISIVDIDDGYVVNPIRYRRDQNICTGIGTLEFDGYYSNFNEYPPFLHTKVYEDDELVGEYYTISSKYDANTGTLHVQMQDKSWYLTDYFIDVSYTIDDNALYKTTRPWVQKFLEDAGVDYVIAGMDDVPLSTNSQLGLMSLYDQILQLLQYSAAYFFFSPEGKCVICRLGNRNGRMVELEDADIITHKHMKHDSMLRNRAVVWGNADPTTGEWVFADMRTITPYNYDNRDLRAVVLSNHNIASVSAAQTAARRLLNEFARINNEFEVQARGLLHAQVGDQFRIGSDVYNANGLITSIAHEMSNKGATTTVVLNERCPRMWAFWDSYPPSMGEYVYVGTAGEGVWRKPLSGSIWEDFNAAGSGVASGVGSGTVGLGYITDLYIFNDNFTCVNDQGIGYYRTLSGTWQALTPSGLPNNLASGTGTTFSGVVLAQACVINHESSELIFAYNNEVNYSGGWVVTYSGTQQNNAYQAYVTHSGVIASGTTASGTGKDYGVTILDIDTADAYNVLTVLASGTGSGTVSVSGGQQWGHTYDIQAPGDISSISIPVPPNALEVDGVVDIGFYDYFEDRSSLGVNPYHGSTIGSTATVRESVDRMYVYWFQYTEFNNPSLGGKCQVCRAKYDVVADEWTTETVEFDLDRIADAAHTWIYKPDQGRDDVVYLVMTFAAFEARILSYKIDFTAGSMTPIVDSLISAYLIPDDEYIATFSPDGCFYYFYIIEDGNSHAYGVRKINAVTGSLDENQLQATDWTQYRQKYGSLPVYHDYSGHFEIYSRPEGGCMYFGMWRIYPKVFGYFYGTEKDFSLSTLIELEPEDPLQTVPDGTSCFGGYTGQTPTRSNMIAYYAMALWDKEADESVPGVAWISKMSAEGTTVSANFLPADKVPAYDMPVSSKYTDPNITINPWYHINDPELAIYSATDGQRIKTVDLSEYFTGEAQLLESRLDDVNDYFYVLCGETLLGITVDGEIKLVIRDFPLSAGLTTRQAYVSNLFVFTHTFFVGNNQGGMSVFPLFPMFSGWDQRTISGGGTYILKQTGEVFETIAQISGQYVLDISNGTPTEVFVRTSGEGIGDTIYQSFTNTSDAFSEINPQYPTYDMRTFRFTTVSGTVASGTMDSPDGQYALIGSQNALKMFPTSLSGSSVTYAEFSGDAMCIETSRMTMDPYIFVAVSGTTVSGASGWAFLQHDPSADNIFTTYSVPAAVTVIRMDDSL